MWTPENRPRYNRDKLRYPSDLTDEEWSHIQPLIPPAKHGGRDREVEEREIVNGLMYAVVIIRCLIADIEAVADRGVRVEVDHCIIAYLMSHLQNPADSVIFFADL